MRRSNLPAAALLASPDDVEAQFYEALQQADVNKLMAVWSDDDESACVHPGGPRLVGPAQVRAGFEAIFANGAVPVQLHAVRRLTSLGCAVHHVIERIAMIDAQGQAVVAWVLSTNVYLKTAQGWRMVLHHASPGSEQPMAGAERPSTLH